MNFARFSKRYCLSECKDDPQAYMACTDDVMQQIRWSQDPQLAEARAIIGRIVNRDLYKFIGKTKPKSNAKFNKVRRALKCISGLYHSFHSLHVLM